MDEAINKAMMSSDEVQVNPSAGGGPHQENVDSSLKQPGVLAGETLALTGTLASMTHEQAAEIIEQHGGNFTQHVSRHTSLLVIGEEGWPLEDDGKPSVKLQHAELLIREGYEIRIIGESEWLSMLGLYTDDPNVKRLYTPAMLSKLLNIPVHTIRSWERAGLIRAEKKVCRLPYFSYNEVTAARRLSELVQSGVTQNELLHSMKMLNKLLPESARVLEQLEILSDQRHLVIRDEHGVFEATTRQRLFNFGEEESKTESDREEETEREQHAHLLRFDLPATQPQTATDWMIEGCRRSEMADSSAAIRCFHQALRVRPDDAEAHFYLADCLYRLGKQEAALERYLAAIENDPEYLEAWTQIGCLYAELHKWTESLLAFDEALHLFPDFPEVHLHKAETLRQMKQFDEAIKHWKRYLELDQRGPWAELAHQRLEQVGASCESLET